MTCFKYLFQIIIKSLNYLLRGNVCIKFCLYSFVLYTNNSRFVTPLWTDVDDLLTRANIFYSYPLQSVQNTIILAMLTKTPSEHRSLYVGLSVVEVVQTQRVVTFVILASIFDSELSMKQHVNKVASSCFYHLRWLRQLRCYVDQEVTMRLMMSLVASRLD